MKKAAIVLDDWKLTVFRKMLTEASFTYKDAGDITHDTTVLTVEFEQGDFGKLRSTIECATLECAQIKRDNTL